MTAGMELAALAPPLEQAPDTLALEALLAEHQKAVFRLALRLLADPDEAASATQDCFFRAYRSLPDCPADPAAQRRWLARVVTNLCLDRLRVRKWLWWRQRLGLDTNPVPASSLRTPERELLAREVASSLARALDRLSPRQRAVFVLRHYEDCSLQEIAGDLSLRVGTVKAHLSRALEILRRELREYYGLPTSR